MGILNSQLCLTCVNSSCIEGASPEEATMTESVDEEARLARKARKRARKKAREDAIAENATEGETLGNPCRSPL